MYNLFSYPDRKRMRVSQVLVLPPFQRQGVGRALLQSVYALADSHNVLDVTVHPLLQHAAFIITGGFTLYLHIILWFLQGAPI